MNDQMILALRGPILVLGGAGFIGANLFLEIQRVRKDVFVVVRRRGTWRLEGVTDNHIFEVDITDNAAVKNLIDSVKPQTVFNCTAFGAYSFEDDQSLIHKTNYTATVDFIEMMSESPFAAYVHAGSSSEYGLNSAGPAEDAPLHPNSQYAVSKAAASQHIFYSGAIRKLPVVNLRLYSVYGPLEDTSRLMPNLLLHALQGKYPPLVAQNISRDFVYITDVCAAFVQAAVKMNPEMYGKSYNIGTGHATTIRELVSQTKNIFNISEDPKFGSMPDRSWDVANWFSNPQLAEKHFGWKSQVTLAQGIELMKPWVSSLATASLSDFSKRKTGGRKRSVSAIIACYKDAQAIPVLHQRLTSTFQKIGCDYEIIFVNDNSPDDSAEVIRALSQNDRKVLGISHSRNFGSQMAFRSGMELSTKDAVVLLDGDLQDPPELIADFYQKWSEGFDVVYGSRIKRDMSLFWSFLYKAFYRIFAAFSYIKIPVDAGDFSLIDRRAMGWLLASPERDLFLRGLRAYIGFRQTGVDYVRPERMFGESTNSLLKNFGWAKKAIFSYSNTPLHVLTFAGFALLGVSILLAVISILIRVFYPNLAVPGATTILLGILFFGALNLVGIGILGEYIGKIIEEVKNRPRLIRSGLIRNGEVSQLLPDGSTYRSKD